MFEVLSQPASGFFGSRLIQEIGLSNYKHYDRIVILVAYARHSGVLRLKPAIEKFMAAGGKVDIAVGVGQGNTTYEALAELKGLGVDLYVYHDSNLAQTFHPKLYLLSQANQRAWASIGSSNLTTAGHYSNYEMNVVTELNLTKKRDQKIFKDITAAIKPYLDTTGNCCRPVTSNLLDQLKDQDYVVTESGAKQSFKAQAKKNVQTKLFGTVKLAKPTSLLIKKKSTVKAQAKKIKVTADVFWKRLSNYDASKKSSPGQIQIPIGYLNRFPPLSNPKVTKKGAMQSDVHLDVLFVENKKPSMLVQNARAILYEPAPAHKRKNNELRFTFLNRGILKKLDPRDILIFRRTDNANTWFAVELVKKSQTGGFTGKTGTKLPDGI